MRLSAYVEPGRKDEALDFCRKHGHEPIFFEDNITCNGQALNFAIATAFSRVVDGLLVHSVDDLESTIQERLMSEGKRLFSIAKPLTPRRASVHPSMIKQQHGLMFKGPTPYGYDMVDGMLVFNLIEQAVIQSMHRMKAEGMTYHEIAYELNSKGCLNKRNTVWYTGAIISVFKNSKVK